MKPAALISAFAVASLVPPLGAVGLVVHAGYKVDAQRETGPCKGDDCDPRKQDRAG